MLTMGRIFRDSFALIAPLKIRLAAWVFVLTGFACLPIKGTLELALLGVTVLLTWFAQLDVTVAALRVAANAPNKALGPLWRRFFAMMVLTTLAILVSAVFVVPAFVLTVRWWIAIPVMLDRGTPIRDALRHSWHETRSYWRPIALVLLVLTGMFVVGFLPMLLTLIYPDMPFPERLSVGNMLAELVISVATLMTILATVAVYRAISNDERA
jgi:Membrane domain of glycerophosphoryl diester phosphodiesterase